MRDKVIGILGGMGPEATIDLFTKIVKNTQAKSDEDHLRIIIDNNPKMPSRQDAILKGTDHPGPYMAETAQNLEHAGADFIIIGANTAHYFYDDVQNAVSIPVLHMIKETVKETIKLVSNVKNVGVLATTGAMKTRIFQQWFEKENIQVLGIPEWLQNQIQESIFSFKYEGLNQRNLALMLEAVDYLESQNAEVLIMGCTEIPLILHDQTLPILVIDPNEVIARKAVQEAKHRIRINE